MQYRSHPVRCGTPGCPNGIPASSLRAGNPSGMCAGCTRVWRKAGIALGGFIPVPTIDVICEGLLEYVSPTKGEIAAALRYARGPRYPVGPWSRRPPYSLQRLIHGRAQERLPHLLVARDNPPSLRTITRGFTHAILADLTMSSGPRYNRWLAGCSFQPRSGARFAAGRWHEIALGDKNSPLFNFGPKNHSFLGSHCLKAARMLAFNRRDRDLLSMAAELWFTHVIEGDFHPFARVPLWATPGKMNTDHPLAHNLKPRCDIPRQYVGMKRRADGLVYAKGSEGFWPTGIEYEPPAPKAPPPPAPPAPSTDWIFNAS